MFPLSSYNFPIIEIYLEEEPKITSRKKSKEPKREEGIYPISTVGEAKESFLNYLCSCKGEIGMSILITRLIKKFGVSASFVKDILDKLVEDGQIKRDHVNKISYVGSEKVYTGVVQAHKSGFGFLICDEDVPDLFLPEEEMDKLLPDDKVDAVCLGYDMKDKMIASVQRVVSRKLKTIVGIFKLTRGKAFVQPEDPRITKTFTIDGDTKGAVPGDVVEIEISGTDFLPARPHASLKEVIGKPEDKGMEIEIAVRKFGVPHKFSEATLEAVKKFSDHVTKTDLRNRVDLRDVPFVTIDGPDAKDFDDAVYCEPIGKDGSYRLLVAIADVSHYVKPGSPIDKDAQERTTSVYFPTKVIPMLPEELSNGLCSLNPYVDRCTLVCDAVLSRKGEVIAYQFYPAVICSSARLVYDNVWLALQDPNGPAALAMKNVFPHIKDLYDLFKILLTSREYRGAMDFETVETYIVADSQGKIEKILPRERNDAHRLIEEMMLVANTCAADLLKLNKTPCLYRVHEPPSEDRLEKVRASLAPFGLVLEGGDKPTPADYCKVLDKIKDRPDKVPLQTLLLRSMQQAVYSPHNMGHFGLAYGAYTHFTSPIRRYPDLLVHRAIKGILAGKTYVPKLLVEPDLSEASMDIRKAEEGGEKIPHIETWEKLGLLCSEYERRADEASYDVMAWLKCYYMRDFIGQTFTGVVTGVAPFAVFVTLNDYYVEGSIHVAELGQDYFVYDEKLNQLKGSYSGKVYKLGTAVRVKLMRCDLENRRIEFILVEEKPAKKAAKTSQLRSRSKAVKERTSADQAREEKPAKRSSPRSKRNSFTKTK